MLVLSRRESERIKLGNSIVLTVIRVSGDRVRLGIEAPPDVLVLRENCKRSSLPLPFPCLPQFDPVKDRTLWNFYQNRYYIIPA